MPSPAAPITVLVADDSAFMRRTLAAMLRTAPEIQIVGTATDGVEAVALAKKLQPDVITLDIEMPNLDGLSALRQLRPLCSAAVLMVSSLTTAGSAAALAALRAGAADFIAKDCSQISLDVVKIEQDLIAKVRALAGARRQRASGFGPRPAASAAVPALRCADFDLILIGSSTGGPPVLEELLTGVPAGLSLPIVIAQHMPVLFTQAMAQRLDEQSHLTIVHGTHGLPLVPGHVYVAPGGQHTRIRRGASTRYRLEVSPLPREALYKPSVNELFASGAQAAGRRVLGIVLTGMGDDGLEGARLLHAQGGTLLAQDAESCVVYGMPKAVTQAGLVVASPTPAQIRTLLTRLASTAAPAFAVAPLAPRAAR